MVTRAVSGLSRETSQRASARREGRESERRRGNTAGVSGCTSIPGVRKFPRIRMWVLGGRGFSAIVGASVSAGYSSASAFNRVFSSLNPPAPNELVRENPFLLCRSLLGREHEDFFTGVRLDLHQVQLIVGTQVHSWMRRGRSQLLLPLHLQFSHLELFQKGGPLLFILRLTLQEWSPLCRQRCFEIDLIARC